MFLKFVVLLLFYEKVMHYVQVFAVRATVCSENPSSKRIDEEWGLHLTLLYYRIRWRGELS